jgi:arylsulfatase A-like enzyme
MRGAPKTLLWVLSGLVLASPAFAEARPARYNVVFIAVDDLRPQLLSYGVAGMKSPALDALGHRGAVFLRAYCQQALCNPSRASVMTGLRPDTIQVHTLADSFRRARPDVVTLPEFFKKNGYRTQPIGKVFHDWREDAQSWTEPVWTATKPFYRDMRPEAGSGVHAGPSWESPAIADDQLIDGMIAEQAVQALAKRARDGQPFFLGVGFSRPHLPLVVPRRYFELYPENTVVSVANPFPPRGAVDIALTDSSELRAFPDVPKEGPIPPELATKLTRAYMASTSYIDAQIGKVTDALAKNGLADRTVVVVWGDHGFHLGEHGIWGKSTNFEVAARAPMIIAAPKRVRPGTRIDALVEFVDIFPTVVELAGFVPPKELEGISLVPLMEDPKRPWKSAAFTQHQRGDWMGRSIRTERYRYTEWTHDGEATQRELYDHATDDAENDNLAANPGHEAVIHELSERLHAGWRAALPKSKN